ncbi:MAG: hypothetical protein KC503_14545 [Myxococcales bacterium]|nr:hypothetical protein [Myxococcales bacterium]
MTVSSKHSPPARITCVVLVALVALALLAAGCVEPDMRRVPAGSASSAASAPGSGSALSPAERRARRAAAVDEDVIKAFSALASCGYQAGRLDYRCFELKALRTLMRKRQSDRGSHEVLARTLAKLLASSKEVERLVAADSVFFYHRKPIIVSALWTALAAEKSPTVEATLIRQLCWQRSARVEKAARERLRDRAKAVAVRAEAANCLGRQSQVEASSKQALRDALASDGAVAVQSNACAALGALADAKSVPVMIAKLAAPGLGWRCAVALSRIGSPAAYKGLLGATDKALRKGDDLAAQQVSALASFASKKHASRARLVALLARIAAAPKVSWLGRKRAARELGILGAKPQLERLAKRYAKADKGNEALVAKAIQQALVRTKALRARKR